MAETNTETRAALDALSEAQRNLSTWTLLFHQAVADRVGLHATDHKCLDLLLHKGPLTAGDLSQLTGLTTGAVTAVVDRLEKHGLVERQHDTLDRRKIYLRCRQEKAHKLFGPVFASLSTRMTTLCSGYTDAELKLLTDFTGKACAMLQDEVQQMRQQKIVKSDRKE